MEKATSYFCSVTDPFCKHANGAKSPYGSRQQTVSYTIRGVVDLTTPASGLVSILFRPVCGLLGYQFDTPATTDWTVPASYTQSSGAHPNFIEQTRVVSAGIRWWNTIPATQGGGTVVVVPIPDDNDIVGFGGSIPWSSLHNSPGVEITDIREAGSYVFQQVDVPKAQEFTDVTSSGAPQNNGYESVLLNCTGPASTRVLFVEWCLHFEGVIDVAQSLAGGRIERPIPLGIQAQQNFKGGYFEGQLSRVSMQIKNFARKHAKQTAIYGAKKLGTAALTYAFGPAGAAAGEGIGLLTDIPEVD
jgi:hypothetical protein